MMRTRLSALLLTWIAPIDAISMKAGKQATPIERIKVAKGFKVELLSQNRNGRQSRVSGKALAAGSSAVQLRASVK